MAPPDRDWETLPYPFLIQLCDEVNDYFFSTNVDMWFEKLQGNVEGVDREELLKELNLTLNKFQIIHETAKSFIHLTPEFLSVYSHKRELIIKMHTCHRVYKKWHLDELDVSQKFFGEHYNELNRIRYKRITDCTDILMERYNYNF